MATRHNVGKTSARSQSFDVSSCLPHHCPKSLNAQGARIANPNLTFMYYRESDDIYQPRITWLCYSTNSHLELERHR